MAVQRSTYAPNTVIQPPFLRKEKEAGSADFVIVDVPPSYQENIVDRRSQNVVWVKIQADFVVTILSAAPSNVRAFAPAHPWDNAQLLLKETELFVVEFEDTNKKGGEQTAVTGYNFEESGILYVKVDKTANTATIYEPI